MNEYVFKKIINKLFDTFTYNQDGQFPVLVVVKKPSPHL